MLIRLAKHFGYNSRLDFYYDIAIEHFDLVHLKELAVEGGKVIFPPDKCRNAQVLPIQNHPLLLRLGKDMVQASHQHWWRRCRTI